MERLFEDIDKFLKCKSEEKRIVKESERPEVFREILDDFTISPSTRLELVKIFAAGLPLLLRARFDVEKMISNQLKKYRQREAK